MAGARQPTANVIAKGRKHLTKEEIDRRLDAEAGVLIPEQTWKKSDKPLKAKVPKWLPENLKKEFRAIGNALIAAGIYSNLDADTLGRYLLARVDYLNAEKRSNHAIVTGDAESARDWSAIQERYFKQCRNCANDMEARPRHSESLCSIWG